MGKVISLLIVDDDPNQCKTLKYILEHSGYQVDTALSSREALKAVGGRQYDLVIMDLVMKGDKNGVEIFKEMKNFHPGIKVLLLTGFGPSEERGLILEGVKEGMLDEILRKPLWPEEILKAVAKHTGGKQNGQ